jgi:hypothetical protein
MPNGNPDITAADWVKIKAFFDRIAPLLVDFADAHNLAIGKYYHESPSWDFCFRHPKRGGASIHIERFDDSTIRLNKSWYIDRYETFTRYFKWEYGVEMKLEQLDLPAALGESLRDLCSWNEEDLKAHPDYEKAWSGLGKRKWAKMFSLKHLPKPKL